MPASLSANPSMLINKAHIVAFEEKASDKGIINKTQIVANGDPNRLVWVPGLKFVPAEFAQAIRQPRVPPASGHARLIGDCREKQLTTKQAVKWVPLKFTQAEKTIKAKLPATSVLRVDCCVEDQESLTSSICKIYAPGLERIADIIVPGHESQKASEVIRRGIMDKTWSTLEVRREVVPFNGNDVISAMQPIRQHLQDMFKAQQPFILLVELDNKDISSCWRHAGKAQEKKLAKLQQRFEAEHKKINGVDDLWVNMLDLPRMIWYMRIFVNRVPVLRIQMETSDDLQHMSKQLGELVTVRQGLNTDVTTSILWCYLAPGKCQT